MPATENRATLFCTCRETVEGFDADELLVSPFGGRGERQFPLLPFSLAQPRSAMQRLLPLAAER